MGWIEKNVLSEKKNNYLSFVVNDDWVKTKKHGKKQPIGNYLRKVPIILLTINMAWASKRWMKVDKGTVTRC